MKRRSSLYRRGGEEIMTEIFVLLCLFHFLCASDILCQPKKFRKEEHLVHKTEPFVFCVFPLTFFCIFEF